MKKVFGGQAPPRTAEGAYRSPTDLAGFGGNGLPRMGWERNADKG